MAHRTHVAQYDFDADVEPVVIRITVFLRIRCYMLILQYESDLNACVEEEEDVDTMLLESPPIQPN